jgi:hypothetical protein
MVDMKAPVKPNASNPNSSAGNKRGAAKVATSSAIAIALQAEQQAQVTVAQARLALRDAAALYYSSNFDPKTLPKNPELANAVKELAATMGQADNVVWGDYYMAPDQSDVTTLQLQPVGFDAIAYFQTPQLQLTGSAQ